MPPAPLPRPTDAELAILRVLWSKGPSTVRQVSRRASPAAATLGYTTVLKLLQIMTDKGLTTREPLGLQHVYTARRTEQDTQRQLVKDLLDRAFDGVHVAARDAGARHARPPRPAELREIKRPARRGRARRKEKKP